MSSTRDGGLACADGCGEWITNSTIIYLVGTSDFIALGKPGLHHRATPLPPTRCLFCSDLLDDQYPAIAIDDVLTIGRCAAHGVWIEGRGRAAFEAAYRLAIARHRPPPPPPAPTPPVSAPTPPSVDPPVTQPPPRPLTLEERVAKLEAKIAELEAVLRAR